LIVQIRLHARCRLRKHGIGQEWRRILSLKRSSLAGASTRLSYRWLVIASMPFPQLEQSCSPKQAMIPTKQRPVRCCGCGGANTSRTGTKRAHSHYNCRGCDLVFVWPQPTSQELERLYDDGESGYLVTAQGDPSRTSPERAKAIARDLERHGIKKGRFMNVGCATGETIYHLRDMGWEVAGVELNPHTASIAQQSGLDVRNTDLSASDFELVPHFTNNATI